MTGKPLRLVAVRETGAAAPGSSEPFVHRYTLAVDALRLAGHSVRVVEVRFARPGLAAANADTEVLYVPPRLLLARRLFHSSARHFFLGDRRNPWDGALAGAVGRHRPDVVLGMTPFRPGLVSALETGPLLMFAEENFEKSWDRRARSEGRRPSTRRRRATSSWPVAAADVVVIAEAERAWARVTYPQARVHVLGNAIDVDFWETRATEERAQFDVLVAGRLADARNSVGLERWLRARDETVGVARLRVGLASSQGIPAGVRGLLRADDVSLGGPSDLRAAYGRAKVVLVPALVSSGVKNQVLQAWASGKPVVTSNCVAEGLGVGAPVLASSSPHDMVRACARLVSSRCEAELLVAAGTERVRALHSQDRLARDLLALVDDVAGRGGPC
jgi:glycosyltransferase involved in cell wall biosynthesis